MSRYYRIFEDHDLDGGLTDPPDDLGPPDLSQADGDVPQQVFWVEMPEDTPWPHFLTGGALLVSEALLGALEAAGVKAIATRPVLVQDLRTRTPRPGWVALEVPQVEKVVDLERSAFDLLMGGSDDGGIPPLVAFNEIVLHASRAVGRKLFRLAEDPTVLIIDETVMHALRSFRPPDGWGLMVEELETVQVPQNAQGRS